MTKVALRGLAARKLRAFTTWLAIFLGVALVAGTYVLTDTINHSFDQIFSESLKGTDVAITAKTDIQQDDTGQPAFPASLLNRVRQVDGVDEATGSIFSLGRFVDDKGDPIGNQFAPNFISSTQPKRFESLNYVDGSPPKNATEASLDTQTADRGNLHVGDTLRIAGEEKVTRYRITGLTKLGDTSFGGAGIAQLTLPEAQRITDKRGKFDQISVAAAPGVSPAELRARIAQVMPPTVQVETGQQSAKRQSDDIADQLKFLKIILLVFAGVSLFVGAFLIFNTFSITVAQRTREFGLLRTLGASRGQVLGSVVLEATVLAALGSAPRSARRDRPGQGDQRAVQELRDRPAEHRHRAPGADDHRVARDRHGGDARRRPGPGAAGHERHADGRAPGRRAVRGAHATAAWSRRWRCS